MLDPPASLSPRPLPDLSSRAFPRLWKGKALSIELFILTTGDGLRFVKGLAASG
jgi:hypothetical protein